MAIALRTLKGTALTYEEVDRNFSQYFYSASIDGNDLKLWYTGSNGLDLPDQDYGPRVGASINLSPFTGDVAAVSPGGLTGNIQFKNGQRFGGTNEFHYDSIKKMVGINTAAPNAPLDVASTIPTPARIRLTAIDSAAITDGKSAWMEFYRGAQTQLATVGLMQPGDSIFYVNSTNGTKFGVGNRNKLYLTEQGLGVHEDGFTGVTAPNQALTVIGKIGVGNSLDSRDQSTIGQIPSSVRSNYLPSNSSTSGLIIESPKGSAGGHVVVGLNSTVNNNESFTILRGATGNYDRTVAVFKADGSVGINTPNPPVDHKLTVNGNISGSGNLSIDGASTLRSTVAIGGATTIGSTLTVAGSTALNSTLSVAGTATITGAIAGLGALTINGVTTLRNGLNLTGKLSGASVDDSVYGGMMEVRERGFVGSSQSAWSFSPAISFHWGNRSVIRLGLRADGSMAIDDNIILHANNFNNYAPNKTGSGASGLWNISITGTAGGVAWSNVTSKPSNIFYYQGFQLDANTMDTNASGFTYANNAPWNGPIMRIGEGSYSLQLNATYGGGGGGISYRTRNGDNSTFNSWFRLYSDTYRPYADAAGNADTVDSFHASFAANANSIPVRNSSGYLEPNNWTQLNGYYGLYSPYNGAHLKPNDSSYGAWKVLGERNGWRGLHFGEGTGMTLMMNEGEFGFHREGHGWAARFQSGTGFFNISGNADTVDGEHASNFATHRGEGRDFVNYSRYVYNNGAYSGTGWIEPSDLGVRYAASTNYATSAGSAGNSGALGGQGLDAVRHFWNRGSSFGQSGYQIFRSGLIIQWGLDTNTANRDTTPRFPVYMNSVLNVQITPFFGTWTDRVYLKSWDGYGFTVDTSYGSSSKNQIFWMAIGFVY